MATKLFLQLYISVIHRDLYFVHYSFTVIFQSVYVIFFWHCCNWFIFKATLFSKGRDHIHTMIVKCPCLVIKSHKAVQNGLCDRWVHIAFNYLNVYSYKKLEKDKSPWCCLCCLKKEMPWSLKNEHLQELMHCKIILPPNQKIITNTIGQKKITNKKLLRKANK